MLASLAAIIARCDSSRCRRWRFCDSTKLRGSPPSIFDEARLDPRGFARPQAIAPIQDHVSVNRDRLQEPFALMSATSVSNGSPSSSGRMSANGWVFISCHDRLSGKDRGAAFAASLVQTGSFALAIASSTNCFASSRLQLRSRLTARTKFTVSLSSGILQLVLAPPWTEYQNRVAGDLCADVVVAATDSEDAPREVARNLPCSLG